MKILVNGKVEDLCAWDQIADVEWTKDLIGDDVIDGLFKWNDELQVYETDKETFEWWKDVIDKLNAIGYAEQYLTKDDKKDYDIECAYWDNLELDTEIDAKYTWLEERGYI